MSDADRALDPVLPANAEIRFYASHRPALLDGDYRLTLDLTLTAGPLDPVTRRPTEVDFSLSGGALSQRRVRDFSVAGPRLSLPPALVSSTFPPDRARGAFSRVLPHVVLARPTLPWERSAEADPGADPVPWLALLVLDPEEVVSTRVVSTAAALGALGLSAEMADDLGPASPDGVRLIALTADVAARVLRDAATLRLCCHVRTVDDHKPGTASFVECAVVVAARTPRPDRRSLIHLVSLEGMVSPGATTLRAGHGTVELASLHSWEIFTQSDAEHGFLQRLKPIAQSPGAQRLAAPIPPGAHGEAALRVAAGWTAAPHALRGGGRTVSWYHGPLAADADVVPDPKWSLPAATSDELLIADATTGMLDISYAAAWELGRLMTLARLDVALGLAAWKRADLRRLQAEASRHAHAHLPHGASPPPEPSLDRVETFFETDLGLLAGVPFGHLVPDPAMLPTESLRFFSLDAAWIDCLMDGAFSIGRGTSGDHRLDGMRRKLLPVAPRGSGFLLRSDVVAGWPDLLVEGYAAAPADAALDAAGFAATPLRMLRFERIAPDVLIVLFDGVVRTLDLHLHPQALHFGLRDGFPIPADRMIDMAALARMAGVAGPPDSATLARGMIDGAPMVRIVREAAS